MAMFRRGPPITGAKIAIFDQQLALGSTTAGESSVVNSFDRAVKFKSHSQQTLTRDRHASVLLLLVCVPLTIIGQPRNSVLIRRV